MEVFRRYCMNRFRRIGFYKIPGNPRFFVRTPFDFKRGNLAPGFFQIVNLLLIVRSPEVGVGRFQFVVQEFDAFCNKKILPECAGIGAEMKGVKIFNEGIANAIVVKINLSALFDLIAQIAGKSHEAKNHKRFFQQVNIFFNGLFVRTDKLAQFVIGNFLPNLQCQRLQQLVQ